MDRPALSGRDDGPTYAGEVARISGPGERRPEQHGPAPVVGPAARQLQLERRTCGARLSKLRRGRRPAPAMKRCQGGSGRSSVVVSEPSKAPPVYLRRRLVRQYGRRKAMRIAFLSTVAVATLSLSVAALGQSPQSPPSGGGGGVERSQSGSGSGGASGSAGQSQGSQQRSGQSGVATSSAPVRARPARAAARTSRVVSSARVRAVVATSSVRGRAPLVATSSVRGRAPLVATSSAPVRARPARAAARTSRVVSSARVRAVVATSSVRGRAPLVATSSAPVRARAAPPAPAALARPRRPRPRRRQTSTSATNSGLGSRRPARRSFRAARR